VTHRSAQRLAPFAAASVLSAPCSPLWLVFSGKAAAPCARAWSTPSVQPTPSSWPTESSHRVTQDGNVPAAFLLLALGRYSGEKRKLQTSAGRSKQHHLVYEVAFNTFVEVSSSAYKRGRRTSTPNIQARVQDRAWQDAMTLTHWCQARVRRSAAYSSCYASIFPP
jgi:hypothetical protein